MEKTKLSLMALTLRNQLKLLLERHEMTAAQLSRKSGVSQQVLSIWLRGGEPKKMNQVKKVADVFGVSVDQLCFGNGLDSHSQRVTELDALLGEDQWVGGLFEVRFRRVKGGAK
ncbi:MAG: helix-turn-helix transcriptional regulator [Bdellovibrionales bacterium]